MISIEEATRLVQDHLPSRRVKRVSLAEALGMVLAEAVTAPEPSPRFTNSAMDGYAVRWEDVEKASSGQPVRLRVVGESRAGAPFQGKLGAGEAVQISTGALLPTGADTVIPMEDTDGETAEILVRMAAGPGKNVRIAGEDIAPGEQVLTAGTTLRPNHIAALAALGVSEVKAWARPQVAILVTGNELVPVGEEPKPGQIRDANGIMLELLCRWLGAEVILREVLPDDPDRISQAVEEATERADVIVMTGGVSVGSHDHVKAGAERAGFHPVFWRVWQKPGKPLFFASAKDRVLFGLPGNPVSAFVCAVRYLAPSLRWLSGREFGWDTVKARLARPVENRSERPTFFQAKTHCASDGGTELSPCPKQGSHMLSSLLQANSIFLVPAATEWPEGKEVEAILYPWG